MAKQFKLSHKPLPSTNQKPSFKEEREMAKDLVLADVSLYSAQELAEMVTSGILNLSDLEDYTSPSNC